MSVTPGLVSHLRLTNSRLRSLTIAENIEMLRK